MGDTGLEQGSFPCGKTHVFDKGGAESGAVGDQPGTDDDLAAVVRAWPGLADPLKAAILAMVESATATHDSRRR